ncbi:S8 family serine peptidase [Lysobacter capsici]|nr:S8 family serine peptidase [Lysobacter capsici]
MYFASKRHPRICALTVAVALGMAGIANAAPPQEQPGDPNRVWIRFQPGQKAQIKALVAQKIQALQMAAAKSAGKAAAVAPISGKTHYEFDNLNSVVMTLPPEVLASLRGNRNLVIEQDVPRYPMAEAVPFGIDKVQARDVVATGADGTGVKVCVIDSGLKADHEDFAGVAITGYAPSGQSWNTDTCGHGTHVAGTIAAVGGNGKGVVGVSPGKVSLHIIKYFDGPTCGRSYSSTLVDAANRCAQAGAKIINMSLGGTLSSSSENTAFTTLLNQGVLSIAAAGNDGNSAKSYPASYASVISVASVDSNNVKATTSQFNDAVDIAAPGEGILSTYPKKGTPVKVNGVDYETNRISGAAEIAVSAPMVDGARCASSGSWSGKVVLCERGDISFNDKVVNAKNGGALGVVIYNNVAGPFAGTLGDGVTSTIPAVSVSQADGQTLRGLAGQTATVSGVTIYNVDSYNFSSGTSMATPHVAGVAALLLSAKPSATPAQLRDAMTSTALDLGAAGRDNEYGFGLVQGFEALEALVGGGTPGNQAPVANFSSAVNGLSVNFTDSSSDSDGSIASRSWNFGDGTTSTATNPSKTYAAAGTYTVTLTVTDNAGATHSKSSTVTVSGGSGGVQTYSNDTDANIPDNNATGVSSSIVVSGRSGNAPSNAEVSVNIVHPFQGDLIVDLIAPDGSVYNLHSRTGQSTDNIIKTYTVNLSSEALNGTWKLRAADRAAQDVGKIDSWSIKF